MKRNVKIFRFVVAFALVTAVLDCFFPFIFPDVEISVETNEGFKIIDISDISFLQLFIFNLIATSTTVLWIFSLFQLWGMSSEWQSGNLISHEVSRKFRLFTNSICVIFIVHTFNEPLATLAIKYLEIEPDVMLFPGAIEELLFFVDMPLLLACILLKVGQGVLMSAIELKEDSQLTI